MAPALTNPAGRARQRCEGGSPPRLRLAAAGGTGASGGAGPGVVPRAGSRGRRCRGPGPAAGGSGGTGRAPGRGHGPRGSLGVFIRRCRVLGSSSSRVFVRSDPTAVNCGVKCDRMSLALPDLRGGLEGGGGK